MVGSNFNLTHSLASNKKIAGYYIRHPVFVGRHFKNEPNFKIPYIFIAQPLHKVL